MVAKSIDLDMPQAGSGHRHPLSLIASLFLCVAGLAATAYSYQRNELSIIAGFLFLYLIGMALALMVSDRTKDEIFYIIRLYSSGYALNVITVLLFALYLTSLSGDPFLPIVGHKTPDDSAYFDTANDILEHWDGAVSSSSYNPLVGYKYIGYSYILAAVLSVSEFFGDLSAVTPRLLNAMCGALILVLTYRIGTIVYGRRIAYVAALLGLLFPIWNYYSAILLRDIVIAYLICLYVYSVSILPDGKQARLSSVLSLGLAVVGLYYLRTPALHVLILATVFHYVFAIRLVPIRMAAIFIFFFGYLVAAFNGHLLGEQLVTELLSQADRWGTGRSNISGDESLAVRFIYDASTVLYAPLIVLYTVWMPVPPIKAMMFHEVLVGIGALIWYFYVPFWSYAMVRSFSDNRARLLTIVTVLFFIAIATIQPDLRHKTQFFGLALVQTAYGLVMLRKQQLAIVMTVGMLCIVLAAIYLWLKR